MEIKVTVWCSVSFHFELEASTDIRPSNFIATFRSLNFNDLLHMICITHLSCSVVVPFFTSFGLVTWGSKLLA
jgi:hypothetical protein